MRPGQISFLVDEHGGGAANSSIPFLQVHVLDRQAHTDLFVSVMALPISMWASWSCLNSARWRFLDLVLLRLWTYHMMPMMAATRQRRENPHPKLGRCRSIPVK